MGHSILNQEQHHNCNDNEGLFLKSLWVFPELLAGLLEVVEGEEGLEGEEEAQGKEVVGMGRGEGEGGVRLVRLGLMEYVG